MKLYQCTFINAVNKCPSNEALLNQKYIFGSCIPRFGLLRIVVTKKELRRFGIACCMKCGNDSIEHAFFECQSFKKLCDN